MNSFNNDMAWEREKSLSINMPGLMKDIYLWVAIALAITGFTAYTVAGSPMLLSLVFAGKFTMWALLIATVALVWHLSSAVARMSLKKAAAMYIIYAVLNGAMMASIFLVYTMTSIASVFFITAGTFAVMSAYGYLTKTDLSKMGNLCLMGRFGLIIATVVNLFLDNSFLEMILAYAGILIFVGLTAYDTKRIREIAFANNTNPTDEGVKLAILCALTLYLDYQCPGCGQASVLIDPKLEALADRGEIELSYQMLHGLDNPYPGDHSLRAAIATTCSDQFGVFPEYSKIIFANQPAREGDGWTDEQLLEWAGQAGISGADLDSFSQCYADRATSDFVLGMQQAKPELVKATPSFTVNGTLVTFSSADIASEDAVLAAIERAA